MRPEQESPEVSLQISLGSRRPIWQALVRRTAVPGKEGSFAKQCCQRAVFELSISYSFVYFTCSLPV